MTTVRRQGQGERTGGPYTPPKCWRVAAAALAANASASSEGSFLTADLVGSLQTAADPSYTGHKARRDSKSQTGVVGAGRVWSSLASTRLSPEGSWRVEGGHVTAPRHRKGMFYVEANPSSQR